MGNKAKTQTAEGALAVATQVPTASTATGGFPLAATKVDPGLAALFAQSVSGLVYLFRRHILTVD